CVVRKSQTAIALAQKKLRRYASKHGTQLQAETLVYAQYVMVLTTFPAPEFSLQQVLDHYRFRWQIELVFKRFKQIAQLGHLPKYDQDSAKSLALWKAVRHLTYRETHPARSRHFPLGLLIGAPSAFPADGVSLPLRFTKSPQQSNPPLPWATCWQTGTRSPKA